MESVPNKIKKITSTYFTIVDSSRNFSSAFKLTLFEAKIPKMPPRFFSFDADIVPLMVSCLSGGWTVGVVSPFCLGVLRSSKGISPGGVKPDLYLSITT